MHEPVFITSIYGRKYLPFLAPFVDSIAQTYPRARGLVLHADVDPREIALLAAAYPAFTFAPTQAPQGNLHQRIARKLHLWRDACAALASSGVEAPLCLIDCDTVVNRRFDHHLATNGEPEWDVIFTWKDEAFPINTGVMLTRDAATGAALFEELALRAERIVRDEAALHQACSVSGAADQHALRELIGFVNYDRTILRTVAGREMIFKGVPCRQLNETNCRPITEDLCITHYKTGWHPILLEGGPFTKNRSEERCREMFQEFRARTAQSAAAIPANIVAAAAHTHAPKFEPLCDGYEERGILCSEMLAVCATCAELNVDVIIESGRCRGQSTRTLARFFEGTGVKIVSIELMKDDIGDWQFAEAQLKPYSNVELLYGDAAKVVPEQLERFKGQRIALLLDGPKGLPAIELIDNAFANSPDLLCAFLHDTRRDETLSPQRALLEEGLAAGARRVFMTDDEEFVARYRHLDNCCLPKQGAEITMHTWRPHMKGEDTIGSYGPTLAVMMPACGVPKPVPAGSAA